MQMLKYLGCHVSKIFGSFPFNEWPVEKTIEDDLDEPVIQYVFNGHGLELRCDRDDTISVIFLHSKEYGGFSESLSELSYSLNRKQVLERLGTPSKSGKQISDPILGDCGAWDRFILDDSVIHIEYKIDTDAINKITLMRSDVVP